MGETTTIQASEELADELADRKRRGDSYEDVIWRLIEAADVEPVEEPSDAVNDDQEGVPLTCEKCGHSWTYRADSKNWATCPDCKTSVKVRR